MNTTFIKTTTKLILLILFSPINSQDNEESEFKSVDDFKANLRKESGPEKVRIVCNKVTKEDLKQFYIKRYLNKLGLYDDAVYLLRYIITEFSIKHLILGSYNKNNYLANIVQQEHLDTALYLKNGDFIEGIGCVAITEIISGVVSADKTSVGTLSFSTEHPIELKDIEKCKRGKKFGLAVIKHKELRIEGPISLDLIKEIHKKSEEITETISIEYSYNFISSLQENNTREIEKSDSEKEDNDSKINKQNSLKKLILEESAIQLAFTDDFRLLDSKIEILVLKAVRYFSQSVAQDRRINIIECHDLQLHEKAIIILPLISDGSLECIDRIGVDYGYDDIILSRFLTFPQECKKILKEKSTSIMEWYDISNKDPILSKTKEEDRLDGIFENPLDLDECFNPKNNNLSNDGTSGFLSIKQTHR